MIDDVGWRWLVDQKWEKMTMVQKLWFSNQVERYIEKFKLTTDEVKKLRTEISHHEIHIP